MNAFLVWCVQSTVLVGVGALLARFLRDARARVWFWQGLLAMLLLLPWVEPWTQPMPEFMATGSGLMMAVAAEFMNEAPVPFWMRIEWWHVLAIGAMARFVWLAAGLWRLRRIRIESSRIPAPIANYRQSIEWFVSDRIAGPVTFGWLRPTILLPSHFCTLPPEQQFAVAWHELLHVERRDWLFVIAEETIRSVLWFHPAAWYALSEVQLAREQVVDGEVVAATRDQAAYLEALVAVAAHHSGADLAPAPLFLKKRQLAVRVAAVLKEAPMSKFKLMTRAILASAAILAAVIALAIFVPFQSEAQTLPDSPGITVDPGALLLHRTALRYSGEQPVTGSVIADLELNTKGEVTDARVVSGPEELRKLVLRNVLEWHYAPSAPASVRVVATFAEQSAVVAPPPPPPPPPPPGFGGRGGQGVVGAVGGPLQPPFVFQRIATVGLSPALEQEVRQKLGFQEGQTVNATASQIQETVKQVDRHLSAVVSRSQQGGPVLSVVLADGIAPPPPPPPPSDRPVPEGVARVSAGVLRGQLLQQTRPVYPDVAKTTRTQGTVYLDAVIGMDGHIEELAVTQGPAMLRQAAMDAVSQWVYRPYLLNGAPTKVLTTIEINFALN